MIVHLFFLLSLSLAIPLMLGQCPAHGPSLPPPQVKRLVLLLTVKFPQVLSLVVAYHCQDSGYRLPNHLAAKKGGLYLEISTKLHTGTRSGPLEHLKFGLSHVMYKIVHCL